MTVEACAVAIERLSFSYPDGTPALREVSLQIAAGERVALAGPNGAGKSTLLLHLNGLLPSRCVKIMGLEAASPNLKAVRQKVGLVFQDPNDQLFCPTIFEDVAFGPRNLRLPPDEVKHRVAQALERTGLAGCEERSAHHISIGQKKRAALASVLSMQPEILVLDEPTSNLDPRGRRELLCLLAGLGGTQIVATHDFDFARRLCRRAIVLDQGRVVADGPAETLLTDHTFLAAHGLA